MTANIVPLAPLKAVACAEKRTWAKAHRARATNEIEYTFEELPLLSEGPVTGGLVGGVATVAYYADCDGIEWHVHEIYLDAYQTGPHGQHVRTFLKVDEDIERDLYLKIWGELTDGSFKAHVQRKVEAAVDEERA